MLHPCSACKAPTLTAGEKIAANPRSHIVCSHCGARLYASWSTSLALLGAVLGTTRLLRWLLDPDGSSSVLRSLIFAAVGIVAMLAWVRWGELDVRREPGVSGAPGDAPEAS